MASSAPPAEAYAQQDPAAVDPAAAAAAAASLPADGLATKLPGLAAITIKANSTVPVAARATAGKIEVVPKGGTVVGLAPAAVLEVKPVAIVAGARPWPVAFVCSA